MRILGIDPGLQVCGYACMDASIEGEKLIEAGVLFERRTDLPLAERLNRIAHDISEILEQFQA